MTHRGQVDVFAQRRERGEKGHHYLVALLAIVPTCLLAFVYALFSDFPSGGVGGEAAVAGLMGLMSFFAYWVVSVPLVLVVNLLSCRLIVCRRWQAVVRIAILTLLLSLPVWLGSCTYFGQWG